MIIDKVILKRGKFISVTELPDGSHIKVLIKCDHCKKERLGYWFKVKDNQTCHSCANRIDKAKTLINGTRYGRLMVISSHSSGKSLCRCFCGNTVVVFNYNLTGGHTLSCGCLQKEIVSKIGHELTSKIYGESSIAYRNGNSNGRNLLSSRTEFKEACEKVMNTNDYKCVKCDSTDNIHIHHIIPYSVNKNLFLEASNMTTLCVSCHRRLHKQFGFKSCNEKSFEIFLNQ